VPSVSIEHLTKRFGENVVLDDVNFTVADGEFVTLLGPSGCGKTTTLLAIAGFVRPEHGVIRCGATTFVDPSAKVDVAAERRNLGIVFQSYAIWPHMTVADNVAFPLKLRKTPKQIRQLKVAEALELVELPDLAGRYPHELSGGQRQRVALARALVYRPSVLLLDEPFSNLDAKLRERARSWLKDLQRKLGITTIFVTHDQHEALSMSDRLLVMRSGRILRAGPPEEVYRDPRDKFVADFIGQCNFVEGAIETDPSGPWLRNEILETGIRLPAGAGKPSNGRITVAIRPEDIELTDHSVDEPGWVTGTIVDDAYLGHDHLYVVEAGAGRLIVRATERFAATTVRLRIRDRAASVVEDAPMAPVTPHPEEKTPA
jgi:iron(III) transport system ATP-binding protein